MEHEIFLYADLSKTSFIYVSDIQHVPRRTITLYFLYFHKLHQTTSSRKAEALDSARSIEAAINHLVSYLSCPKFHLDTRVQVGDVLRDLLPIRNDVTYMASNLYNGGTNGKNK